MWQIVIVDTAGSNTYKYQKTGSGAYSLSDAIIQALRSSETANKNALKDVTSVTATII